MDRDPAACARHGARWIALRPGRLAALAQVAIAGLASPGPILPGPQYLDLSESWYTATGMRLSKRRALEKQKDEYLKGDEKESPRYCHATLEIAYEIKRSDGFFLVALALFGLSACIRRADCLAA